MKNVNLQLAPDKQGLYPFTQWDHGEIQGFLPNQVLKAKLEGYKHPRSPKQLRFVHALFEMVAHQTGDPRYSNNWELI
jgi:hypothetical protein